MKFLKYTLVSFFFLFAFLPAMEQSAPKDQGRIFSRRTSLLYALMKKKWCIKNNQLIFKNYADKQIIYEMHFDKIYKRISEYISNPDFVFKPYFGPIESLNSPEKKNVIKKLQNLSEKELFKIQLDEFKVFLNGKDLNHDNFQIVQNRKIMMQALESKNLATFLAANEHELTCRPITSAPKLIKKMIQLLKK